MCRYNLDILSYTLIIYVLPRTDFFKEYLFWTLLPFLLHIYICMYIHSYIHWYRKISGIWGWDRGSATRVNRKVTLRESLVSNEFFSSLIMKKWFRFVYPTGKINTNKGNLQGRYIYTSRAVGKVTIAAPSA